MSKEDLQKRIEQIKHKINLRAKLESKPEKLIIEMCQWFKERDKHKWGTDVRKKCEEKIDEIDEKLKQTYSKIDQIPFLKFYIENLEEGAEITALTGSGGKGK